MLDLSGRKFGRLVVESLAQKTIGGRDYWNCFCDCGGRAIVQGNNLVSGNTESCGCLRKKHKKDLVGQRFGRLLVISPAEHQAGRPAWNCRCDCGNLTIKRTDNLRSGNSQSCGCLFTEVNRKVNSLTGQRFGRLVVLEKGPHKGRRPAWNCLCDCGNIVLVTRDGLISGDTQSCGCLHKEAITKHGLSHLPIYRVWSEMKARCTNVKHPSYKYYGGRGITVCAEWLEFPSFYEWAMNNGYKSGLDLDRKNNDGGYTSNNCRFITHIENTRNTGRTRNITYEGRTQSMSAWSIELGINDETLKGRLDSGWSVEKAFTTKVKKK